VINQAAPAPIMMAPNPTDSIRASVVRKYRGNVVDNKCGQMFSVGKKAK
jgi:hypothetical protein